MSGGRPNSMPRHMPHLRRWPRPFTASVRRSCGASCRGRSPACRDGPSPPPSQIARTSCTCWWTLSCASRCRTPPPRGVSVAAWVRQAMRQVTPEDFPPSWRAEASAARSHESGDFHRKCGLRLDAVTSRKLAAFMHTFERSAAAIIRELIAQASPEDFPPSWHMAAIEPRPQDARAGGGRARASHEHPRAP